jgi:hypothetical protein
VLGGAGGWRRQQSRQRTRRSLTRRGQATLAGLGLCIACSATLALRPGGEAPAAAAAALADEQRPVAAAPPEGASLFPEPGTAEASGAEAARAALFARLPVTRAALALPARPPEGSGAEADAAGARRGRLYEMVPASELAPGREGLLRVEYTLDAELTERVFGVLERGHIELGHVIVLEPASGRVLAYASTDIQRFPPTRIYPAASLVKVITAAAALEHDPERARLPCRFQGSPYRLTPARLDPPRRGSTVTLERALATSNNQCFAQLAVHALGFVPLREAIGRFGWLAVPAPGHQAGEMDAAEDRYAVGRLGCGLEGCRITPLHAAQLAAVLARGERVAPRWIERVLDAEGNEIPLPPPGATRPVLSPERAAELREMLAETTARGTARSAFRDRRGRPRLGSVRVAGKTGSLSGTNPRGRYEWFAGAAPVEHPSVAVAVVVVQSHTWWRSASQIAADVLAEIFCAGRTCGPEQARRFTSAAASSSAGSLAAR